MGQIPVAPPIIVELFHLFILLLHIHATTLYRSLRTVDGNPYKTFQQACLACGLTQDNHM